MTDATVTQAPVLVLAELAAAETRSTQAAALALVQQSAVGARATQASALSLLQGDLGETRVGQGPALVLCQQVPCATHWVQTWRIARLDGQVFRFTDHDRPVSFMGQTFSPCDSLAGSAAELAAFIGQVGSQELAGIVADDGISEEDLHAGRFDGATVEVWLVPWSQGGGTIPRRLFYGTVEGVSHGQHGFTAEVLTPGAKLQQRALLDHYTVACRWPLGDPATCGVALGPLTVAGTATHLSAVAAGNLAHKRIFRDSARAEAAGHFDLGLLTWTSGANAGVAREVKSFAADGTFVLWEPCPKAVQIGDAYTVYPGCDKTEATCKGKFANFDRYGGFPDVPGRDRVSQTPNAKSGGGGGGGDK